MDEYIEKGAAIAVIMSEPPDAHYPHWYADKIKSIPAADVIPVRHGRWIYDHWCEFRCSVCGEFSNSKPYRGKENYCPNCGARMNERNE